MNSTMLYILTIAFIAGWWITAFKTTTSSSISVIVPLNNLETEKLIGYLSPIQREALKEALAGNTRLMLQLINQWETDAEALTVQGKQNIDKLPSDKLLQATVIGQLIRDSSPEELQRINNELRSCCVTNDCGHSICANKISMKLLPQTDMTAGLLLALCDPEEIIALPSGIMNSPLYSNKKIANIQSCASKLRSEQLYLLSPDIACLAYYTHPSTKELYSNLSISTYTTKNLDSIHDIQNTLIKLGHLSNHPLEATLLSIFIDSALIAIDNRITALSKTPALKSTMYLYHHHHYMVPTNKCLSGQLMNRAVSKYQGLTCHIPDHDTHWRLPISQETILQSNPDCLLLASATPIATEALKETPVFILDEYVQDSPNQYIVLAYYDIFQALAAAHCL